MGTDSQTPPAAGGKWVMDQTAFDRLLAWLDPERERAGQRYEDIRLRLIKIFTCRGCRESEDLADETVNRVARRLPDIIDTYTGDPALYFIGVAQNIIREYLRKPAPVAIDEHVPPPPVNHAQKGREEEEEEEEEREYACLERCMNGLAPAKRYLVLKYYSYEGGEKIERRKRLAVEFGIGLNALRIRACRIRESLYRCVTACLSEEVVG